jgi:hypothetical protein
VKSDAVEPNTISRVRLTAFDRGEMAGNLI